MQVERHAVALEAGTEVYSLCMLQKGHLALSYAWRTGNSQAAAEVYNQQGALVKSMAKVTGKVSKLSVIQV
jgi:hypothetical protein